MEWFLIALLTAAAAAAILVPYLNGNTPRKITAAILIIPAAYIGYTEYQTIALENNLSAVIQQHSNNPELKVSCHRYSHYFIQTNQRAGQVWFDANGTASTTTELMYTTCETLKPLLRELTAQETINPTAEQTYAFHVLSHELQHLQNIKDEAAAECYAHQNNPTLFQLFNIKNPTETATTHYQTTYAKNHPRYKSTECKPGGELDLNLTPSVFSK